MLRKIFLLIGVAAISTNGLKTITKTVHRTRTISCKVTSIIDFAPISTTISDIDNPTETYTEDDNIPIETSSDIIPNYDTELVNLLNAHCVNLGMNKIPFSKDAWLVASTHNYDLQNGNTGWSGRGQSGCSAHSWSNSAKWSGCCYVIRNPNGPCMWNKPYEITGNRLRRL